MGRGRSGCAASTTPQRGVPPSLVSPVEGYTPVPSQWMESSVVLPYMGQRATPQWLTRCVSRTGLANLEHQDADKEWPQPGWCKSMTKLLAWGRIILLKNQADNNPTIPRWNGGKCKRVSQAGKVE